MKSYTDLEQSKKLEEFLPLESADMIWVLANPDLPMIRAIAYEDSEKSKYYEILPAWSLAALFGVVREIIGYEVLCLDRKNITIKCELGDEPWSIEMNSDNEVDGCYEMIIKLHEQKLL